MTSTPNCDCTGFFFDMHARLPYNLDRTGCEQRFKTLLLRRSAVVDVCFPFLPKAVVRLASDDNRVGSQIKPRLQPTRLSSLALVNDLGPRIEVDVAAPGSFFYFPREIH